MALSKRIAASCILLLLSTIPLASASDRCAVDFKALLSWRTRLVLTATESKYLSREDCLREITRSEFLKPDLSPRCAHVIYPGSSVEQEDSLDTAFDSRDLFRTYSKKPGKSSWLGNLYQALFERSVAHAKEQCQKRDFSASKP